MKAKWLVILFVLLCCLAVPFFACDDDDDNDDDNVDDDDTGDDDIDDDDTSVDDDTSDDDTSDDDTGDDDSIDDDTDIDHAPVVTESYWEPEPPVYGEVAGFGLVWYTYMVFYVCDEDNDLLPDGVLIMETPGPFGPDYFPLEDFQNPPETDLSNAGDCSQPVRVSLFTYSPDAPSSGEHCTDFYVEDSAGNRSDVFSPCFTMP
ncbi:MAG TPA: hypothetical protein PK961_06890 [bacterium]|nr:hypothetical protein [bacterium]